MAANNNLPIQAQLFEIFTNNNNARIPFYKLTLDPTSFENSLRYCEEVNNLVLQNFLAIHDGEDHRPTVCMATDEVDFRNNGHAERHTLQDEEVWQELIAVYNVNESMLAVPAIEEDIFDVEHAVRTVEVGLALLETSFESERNNGNVDDRLSLAERQYVLLRLLDATHEICNAIAFMGVDTNGGDECRNTPDLIPTNNNNNNNGANNFSFFESAVVDANNNEEVAWNDAPHENAVVDVNNNEEEEVAWNERQGDDDASYENVFDDVNNNEEEVVTCNARRVSNEGAAFNSGSFECKKETPDGDNKTGANNEDAPMKAV